MVYKCGVLKCVCIIFFVVFFDDGFVFICVDIKDNFNIVELKSDVK